MESLLLRFAANCIYLAASSVPRKFADQSGLWTVASSRSEARIGKIIAIPKLIRTDPPEDEESLPSRDDFNTLHISQGEAILTCLAFSKHILLQTFSLPLAHTQCFLSAFSL